MTEEHKQMGLFTERIRTPEGIKYACVCCRARFIPSHELNFVCQKCMEEVGNDWDCEKTRLGT